MNELKTRPASPRHFGMDAEMTEFLDRRDLCKTVSAGAWERAKPPSKKSPASPEKQKYKKQKRQREKAQIAKG